MRVLITGCGYVGLPLSAALVAQGHEVLGVARSAERLDQIRKAGAQALGADITKPEQLHSIPGRFDWVVNLVSSSRGGPDDYRQVYLEGTRNLLNWLNEDPPRKLVYTSSTGVYGQTDGSQVKESSPTEPIPETSKILVETEKLLLGATPNASFRRSSCGWRAFTVPTEATISSSFSRTKPAFPVVANGS